MKLRGRRRFLKQSLSVTALLATPNVLWSFPKNGERQFRMSLNPGAIGVRMSQFQLVETAARFGFEAIAPQFIELAGMSSGQVDAILGQMSESELTWDAAGLPVEFRGSEPVFRENLLRLHPIAAGLMNAGVTRMSTWIMPTHSELTYRKNFDLHIRRLRLILDILKDYNIRLGLEYVGPRTLMNRDRYPFIRSLAEIQELITEVNRANLGIQLDSFHWHCAGETEADLLRLNKEMIVTCDLNDAIQGRSPAEQIDSERTLPGETGVINLKAFVNALNVIEYDGPVRAEPFNEELNQQDDDVAIQKTYDALKNTFDLINN